MYVFHALRSPPSKVLRKLGRIAIWNKQKFVFAFAMGLWVADVSFLIDGMYLLQIIGKWLVNLVILQVPCGWVFSFDCLDRLGLPGNFSYALNGHLSQKLAPCLTLRPLNLALSVYSLPTFCYLSPCSLACSACVSNQAVPSAWQASSGSRYRCSSFCHRNTLKFTNMNFCL